MNTRDRARLHEGHCACGQVQFQLLSEPLVVHGCHCIDCQRETGSAFALNALIESDRVRLTRGVAQRLTIPSQSGSGQEVVFCGACATVLWSHYAYPKVGRAMAFVRVGTLQSRTQLTPDVHIYIRSKQPWLYLADHAQQFAAYYRPSEVWSEESLHRLSVLERVAGQADRDIDLQVDSKLGLANTQL